MVDNLDIMSLENFEKRRVNVAEIERVLSLQSDIIKGIDEQTLSEKEVRPYIEEALTAYLVAAKLNEERLSILKKFEEGKTSKDD